MLSNNDIIKELGKNIEIFPLKADNLRGASVNLTASSMAWSVSDKKSAVDQTSKIITIKKHDATLVLTNEVFAVSNKIGGTFSTRVADASMGVGHISTVINPGWCGRPLIAITNPTDTDIHINVNDPVVIMILDYLHTPSTKKEDSRKSSRYDILHDYALTQEEKDVVFHNSEDNREKLHNLAKSQKVYDEIKRTERKRGTLFTVIQLILALVSVAAIIWIALSNNPIWITLPSVILTVIVTNNGRWFYDKFYKA